MFQSGCMLERNRISAPGRFGKLEAVEPLVLASRLRPPTMYRTCSFESSSSIRSTAAKPCSAKRPEDRRGFFAVAGGEADEHVGLPLVGDPVVELGHVAIADDLAEAFEAAAFLGDRDREQRLALFADLGTLGDEAEPVEVHVRPAGDRDQRLVLEPVPGDVLLHRGDAHRPGRFEDAPRVLEHVLDGGADRVGVDDDEVVDQGACQAEGLLAHQLDGRTVGEQADVVERGSVRRP